MMAGALHALAVGNDRNRVAIDRPCGAGLDTCETVHVMANTTRDTGGSGTRDSGTRVASIASVTRPLSLLSPRQACLPPVSRLHLQAVSRRFAAGRLVGGARLLLVGRLGGTLSTPVAWDGCTDTFSDITSTIASKWSTRNMKGVLGSHSIGLIRNARCRRSYKITRV